MAAVAVEYVPASHGLHVRAVNARTVDEYLPASQLVHAPFPFSSLYFPAAHASHELPDNVKPLSHRQTWLPSELHELDPHGKHAEFPGSCL